MTVVNHETGEIVETIGADEARRLTTEAQNEFRSGAAHTARAWELVEEAVMGGGHIDLGYRSPGDYLQAEFDGVLAGFNIAERRLAVRTMTSWGLSTRAIAPVVGVSDRTVSADQKAGAKGFAPAPQTPEPVEDGEADAGSGQTPEGEAAPGDDARPPVPSDSLPRPAVTGIDGKTYPKPKPKKPARKPLTDSFRDAALDLDKLVSRWQRLADDDRFPRNKNEVARYANDLIRAREALDRLIEQMSTNEKEPTSV